MRYILGHLLQKKSLQAPFIIVYEFDKMIVETDEQSNLGKNKDKSFTVKTSEHIPIGFVLAVHYLESIGDKNE